MCGLQRHHPLLPIDFLDINNVNVEINLEKCQFYGTTATSALKQKRNTDLRKK